MVACLCGWRMGSAAAATGASPDRRSLAVRLRARATSGSGPPHERRRSKLSLTASPLDNATAAVCGLRRVGRLGHPVRVRRRPASTGLGRGTALASRSKPVLSSIKVVEAVLGDVVVPEAGDAKVLGQLHGRAVLAAVPLEELAHEAGLWPAHHHDTAAWFWQRGVDLRLRHPVDDGAEVRLRHRENAGALDGVKHVLDHRLDSIVLAIADGATRHAHSDAGAQPALAAAP
mmetsp:Transcript_5071/g.14447  ORF Transcript_5071/g.14447 Transcript_5071/m.14447 type:complete len:231 (-) Transcript_5071:854-1546(-)